MKNFIDNILGVIVAIISLVIVVGSMMLIGAFILHYSGDILMSIAAGIITPIGIMDWLGLI